MRPIIPPRIAGTGAKAPGAHVRMPQAWLWSRDISCGTRWVSNILCSGLPTCYIAVTQMYTADKRSRWHPLALAHTAPNSRLNTTPALANHGRCFENLFHTLSV
jgi:hypothetical protein